MSRCRTAAGDCWWGVPHLALLWRRQSAKGAIVGKLAESTHSWRSFLIQDLFVCLSNDQYLTDLTALCNSFVAMFTLNNPTPSWDFSRLGTRGRKTRTCWDPWRHGPQSPSYLQEDSVCPCLRFRPSYSALYGQLPVQSVRNTEYLQINYNLHCTLVYHQGKFRWETSDLWRLKHAQISVK